MENSNVLTTKNKIQGGNKMIKNQEEINMDKIQEEIEENITQKDIKKEIKQREIEVIIRNSKNEKTILQKSKERDGLRRLVDNEFRGNMTTCARAARVSTSTVSRVINGETRMGGRLLRGIMGYLERNNLQYSDYFSFN